MRLAVVKGRMGDWIYYSGVMSFKNVKEHVEPSINRIYQKKVLDEILQRDLTNNAVKIKEYLLKEKQRFFNAIVLAIYGGDPQWLEAEFEEDIYGYSNVGFLEFSGKELIFPVDGQHRVKGIIEAVKENPSLAREQVPVIFIAHQDTEIGIKRTRKLFSTLNRRAKPVGQNENIALDEDDVCAIATRWLLQNNDLFSQDTVIYGKGKQIPKNDFKSFTSLIALYQCVDIIIGWKLSKEGIKGEKYKDYKQYRPEEEEIAELEGLVADVFKAFVENTMAVKEYLKCEDEKKAAKFRNGDGGNILFRPAILTEYIYVATLLYDKFNDWTKVFVVLNNISHELNDEPWKGYLWDGKKIGRRISKVLTRQVLLYMVDQNLLDDKKEKFIEEYARAINKNQNEAKEVLDKSIANNR